MKRFFVLAPTGAAAALIALRATEEQSLLLAVVALGAVAVLSIAIGAWRSEPEFESPTKTPRGWNTGLLAQDSTRSARH